MLKRSNRLAKANDFAKIYKTGKRRTTQNLSLIYLKTNQNTPRFGFVVSKKQAGRIVDRNRIKRRLRAQVSKRLPLFIGTIDAIISGKKGVLTLKKKELEQEVENLINKAGIAKAR